MFKTAPALLALCASLAVAAPAAADSIAYVKDGDIWLASPDGARQQQVTRTGEYSYVSQSDDGTFAALAPGERIRTLDRTGHVLSEVSTYVSDGAPQGGPISQFGGPFEPEISPDGKLIAYEWMNASYYNDHPGCSESTVPPCYVLESRWGVGITHTDRFTPHDEFGLITGWIGPHWMSNDLLLRSHAPISPNEDAVITRIGPGKGDDELKRWFWDDNGASGVEEVEISRDQKVAAGVAGFYSDELRIYRVAYDPLTAPEQKLGPFEDNPDVVEPCIVAKNSVPQQKFENVSFAPDHHALAVSDADGIPPASAYEERTACCAPPPPPVDDGGEPKGPQTPALSVTGSAAKLRGALRRGVTVTVQAPGAGKLTASGTVGARRVASAKKSVAAAGATTLRLTFTKAAKRSLKRKRSAKLAVAVTFRPAAGAPQRQTVAIRLK